MDTTLKAYEVREPDEGNCVVVFAEKSVVARREGAAELNCEFEEVESCTRAPWADEYAPGPVPLHASLAAGWWHSCCGCGCTFDSEGITSLHDEENPPAIDPVQDSKRNNYCSAGCMMADWQKRQEQKVREALSAAKKRERMTRSKTLAEHFMEVTRESVSREDFSDLLTQATKRLPEYMKEGAQQP